ncbi:MAG: UbiA family prenyltransferase [Chitinispirillales bacterium]|jgi:4-hydroxybenzoate polyprenyltransferase|nr:UbiA family prenyltransferase [Chitinispirillales bacterium]
MLSILTKTADALFLLRLPLLAPVWTVLMLGWIAGNAEARVWGVSYGSLFINLFGFSLVVASIYVINQIEDIESDRINRKLFLLPQGIISIPAAWALAVICAAGGFAVALTQGVWMFSLFALGFVIGILYNSPPASLKNRPIGGWIANSLGHGAITFLVGWLSAKGGAGMTPELFAPGLLSSLAPAFANGAVFLATTVPDADGDRQTGKRTFCVAYGAKATAAAAAAMCALALAASFLIENRFYVMAIPAALSLWVFVNFAVTMKQEAAFHSFKWPVFLLSAFVMLYVPVYGALVLVTFLGSRLYYKLRFGIVYPTFMAK